MTTSDIETLISQVLDAAYFSEGNPSKFVEAFKNVLVSEMTGDTLLHAGSVLFAYSKPILAVEAWTQALQFYVKDENCQAQAVTYTNLGICQATQLKDYSKALENFYKNLSASQPSKSR